MLIELVNVTVERGGTVVLRDVNSIIKGPGLVQVIGPNGAGKTTLFLTILGVIRPVRGVVRVNGVEVNGDPGKLGEMVSYVPQRFYMPRDAPLSLWEFVEMYAKTYSRRGGARGSLDYVRSKVSSALETVRLPREVWQRRVSELSGGQLQRALIARALSVDAEILLMDEPLSNIDPEGRGILADIIGELSREKLLLVSSHDPMLLLSYTSKILLLGYGEYRYGDPDEILTREALVKIYKGCAIILSDHAHIADWH